MLSRNPHAIVLQRGGTGSAIRSATSGMPCGMQCAARITTDETKSPRHRQPSTQRTLPRLQKRSAWSGRLLHFTRPFRATRAQVPPALRGGTAAHFVRAAPVRRTRLVHGAAALKHAWMASSPLDAGHGSFAAMPLVNYRCRPHR